jgi:MFS family permease
MYPLEWIEQLKLKVSGRGETVAPATPGLRVGPVVWYIGLTSLLTDISSEMVNSALPVYLVLHLHLSPLQYGVIDGIYNGFAIALLSLAAGIIADRTGRQKELAASGYLLSGLCKLLLLFGAGAWTWLATVIAIDRAGKGIRSAPRDALISLSTPHSLFATAFGIHRALDAGGSLLGPIVAFVLLTMLPGAFDVLWLASFLFAMLALSVLWLFVPKPDTSRGTGVKSASLRSTLKLLEVRRFRSLAVCALLLATATVSDGFVYLLLQQKSGTPVGFFPLFYVVTATAFMLFAVPISRVADRIGRTPILLFGYVVLAAVYVLLATLPNVSTWMQVGCLLLFGLYYASTEGILMAMASAVVPPQIRTSGLALLGTCIGIGKVLSSILFGWMWTAYSPIAALSTSGIILLVALAVATVWLNVTARESTSV